MLRLVRSLLCALALVTLDACAATHGQHVETAVIEADIAAVTLANDCAGTAISAGDAAPGRCFADGECPSFCQQTAVQLQIDAAELVDATVPFEVLAIRLRTMDGTLRGELDPRAARVLASAGIYTAWDEQIGPGDRLDVTYDTSAPDWSAIGGGDPWSTYGMEFRIEMDVRIDGEERTLEFAPASREHEVVT